VPQYRVPDEQERHVQVALGAGLPYADLRDSILAHSTMAEGLIALVSAVPARA